MICRILDAGGSELASSPGLERALRIMNTLDGAVCVVDEEGVLLATRSYLNAESVNDWLTGLGRWRS